MASGTAVFPETSPRRYVTGMAALNIPSPENTGGTGIFGEHSDLPLSRIILDLREKDLIGTRMLSSENTGFKNVRTLFDAEAFRFRKEQGFIPPIITGPFSICCTTPLRKGRFPDTWPSPTGWIRTSTRKYFFDFSINSSRSFLLPKKNWCPPGSNRKHDAPSTNPC